MTYSNRGPCKRTLIAALDVYLRGAGVDERKIKYIAAMAAVEELQ